MKKISFLLLLSTLFGNTYAQDRVYWSAACPSFARMASNGAENKAAASVDVTNPTANTAGWFQGTGSSTTGTITPRTDAYSNVSIWPEYGMAVSPSGFLYGIAGSYNKSFNAGVIQLAYKSAIVLDNAAPSTTPAFDLNGSSGTDVLPVAIGISTSGKGGFLYYDGTVLKYIGFTANANGSVTWGAAGVNITGNNTDNPTAWSNEIIAKDLVFDDAGDLYILAERYDPDYTVMENVVYAVPAAGLSSPAIVAPLKWTISDNKTLINGSNTGLGYASGSFYISQSETTDFNMFTNYITAIQPPATGSSIVLGDNYTVLEGYCEITDLAVIPASVLPADWGAIDALIQNNQLKVQWQTLKESGNDHFEVEVSADGKTFSGIGKVDSKAVDGNSDAALSYSFNIDVNGVVIGFSAVALLMLFIRRRKTFLALATVLGMVMIAQVGCSKNSSDVPDTDATIFVRIAQVDKDSKKTYSKVVQARK